MAAGDTTPSILGQLYKSGVTESPGPADDVIAQIGYGPAGTDPRYGDWTWLPAAYSSQIGDDDQYTGDLSGLLPGTYAYTYRFSIDDGSTWAAADLTGDGSNPDVSFIAGDIGTLTVTPPAPEPASMGAITLTALILCRRRKHA
jgi:hypothetical protein